MKNYCTHKKITKLIGLLKKEKRIPRSEFLGSVVIYRYNPNFRWIQSVFLENGLHLYWENKLYNERWWQGTTQGKEKIEQNEKEYLPKMLREIIICDFERRNFQRKNRNEEIIRKGRRGEEVGYWPFTECHMCVEDLERSGEVDGPYTRFSDLR